MTLSEVLNNRETAIALWVGAVFVAALFFAGFRASFGGVLRALLNFKILRMWLLMVVYTAVWVLLFYQINWWTWGLLKDTLFWLFFAGTPALFKANKVDENRHYFKEAVLENLKFGVLLEFVTGLFSFPLWQELIIIPAMTLIALLSAFTKQKVEDKRVHAVLKRFLMIAGLVFFYHLIKQTIMHWHELTDLEHLRALLVTPILSLLFLPFIYLLSVYMVYEANLAIACHAIKSPVLEGFAKKQALLAFKTDRAGIKRWARRLWRETIVNKEDILRSIVAIKARQRMEKSPPEVPVEKGWSPFIAASFTGHEKLDAGFYDLLYEKEWAATSANLYIGEEWLSNFLLYTLTGNEEAVTELELNLKVFTPQPGDAAQRVLARYANQLYLQVFREELPDRLLIAIMESERANSIKGHHKISVRKESWKNSNKSYDLIFCIKISPLPRA